MDRKLIYPGQIPLETDLLGSERNTMVALAALASAMFGGATTTNGLSCGPTSPASMNVKVGAGEIYSQQNLDSSAYSSLAADTAHQIMKQGILLDAVTLACPAPTTTGQSINYLIQATFSETDTDNVVLPYYNASDPTTAYTGPNNSGVAQPTTRKATVAVTVKAGIAAATGSQVTPTPDAGNVGLWVVTVAYGATTITSGAISQYSAAPLIASKTAIGYVTLPGGLILNWGNGQHSDSSGAKAVTFAKPFSTSCLCALASNAAGGPPSAFHGTGDYSTTGMTIYSASSASVAAGPGTTFDWFAIGF